MSNKRTNALVAGLLAIAPLLVAAKGCDAVVGNDRKPCGGLAGTACPENQFCDFAPAAMCGAADQTGVCRPIPNTCTEQYDPVCGCDDQTYGNACLANLAGISVASQGECGGSGGEVCGGLTGAACSSDQFCNFPSDAMCGIADATGTCEARPDGCIDIFSPVCACDGHTYPNACEANSAGFSVASEGECDGGGGGGELCGGLTGAACAAGEFCNFPPGGICGAADFMGTCTPIPVTCTTDDNPVCGCDGTTYSNECSAHRAGISAAHVGPCP